MVPTSSCFLSLWHQCGDQRDQRLSGRAVTTECVAAGTLAGQLFRISRERPDRRLHLPGGRIYRGSAEERLHHRVGEENRAWDYAKFLLGNERVGVAPVGATKRVLAQAKEWAGPALEDPLLAARFVELENELLALELTALRVVAHSADGKPHPASSVLKLKGSELQQAVSELVLDLAGPAGLASGADADDTSLSEWERVAGPLYLNLRKASIYGGSNEVQRQIIARNILGL